MLVAFAVIALLSPLLLLMAMIRCLHFTTSTATIAIAADFAISPATVSPTSVAAAIAIAVALC